MERLHIIFISVILILIGIIIYLLVTSLQVSYNTSRLVNAQDMVTYVNCTLDQLMKRYSLLDIIQNENSGTNSTYRNDRNNAMLFCLS